MDATQGEELKQVVVLAKRTARAVQRMGHRLDYVEAGLSALASKVEDASGALERNSRSNDRLSDALGKLGDRLASVDERLDSQVLAHAEHLREAEADKRSLARFAVGLWVSSLSAGALALGWLATVVSPGLAHWLREWGANILSRGGS